jgi:undecaprenyl-diphosphatase
MPLTADARPSHRALVIAAGLIVANLLMFFLIAEDLFDGGGLVAHDQAVLGWFVDHRTDAWIRAARFVSTIGGFASLAIVGVVLGLVLWRRGVNWLLAAAPLASLLLASLASTVAKSLFNRDRPPVTVHETTVTLAAFPSGHSTDAAAFFLALALTLSITAVHRRSTKVLLFVAGLLCAGLVGLSRLILGVHWLSDVVAGWTLGWAIGLVVTVGLWYAVTEP